MREARRAVEDLQLHRVLVRERRRRWLIGVHVVLGREDRAWIAERL